MTRQTRKRPNHKPNAIWVFLAIIIVIAILTMIVSYFYVDEDKPDVLLVPPSEQPAEERTGKPGQQITSPIDGIWVSNYDGAMLTLNGNRFRLEISGVDVSDKIEGKLSVEDNIVTFVYTSGTEVCKDSEGHYLYSLEDDGDIFFKLIKDPCESRKERMSATWFRM